MDLNKLPTVIRADRAYSFLSDGDWISGGCALLAQALLPLLSPNHSLLMVGRATKAGVLDHMVICTPKGLLIDADGVQTLSQMAEKLQSEFGIIELTTAAPNFESLTKHCVILTDWDIPGLSLYLKQSLC